MIRWGILGTGNVANKFAEDLRLVNNARLSAVGSRSKESAQKFADKHKIPLPFASYDELAACPDIDVIYIATPHIFHRQNTLLCLRNGKNVLCEKPFAMNKKEAQEMITLAGTSGLFLMEAVWTFFLPFYSKLQELIEDETIGKISDVSIFCGLDLRNRNKKRDSDLNLGGGILMDMGLYPISLMTRLLGKPKKILSSSIFGKTGVDEVTNLTLEYQNLSAKIICSMIESMENEVIFLGTKGSIKVCSPWWLSKKIIVCDNKQNIHEYPLPYSGNGYSYEAQAVTDCIAQQRKECNNMPLASTLSNIELLDKIREEIGLKYPIIT